MPAKWKFVGSLRLLGVAGLLFAKSAAMGQAPMPNWPVWPAQNAQAPAWSAWPVIPPQYYQMPYRMPVPMMQMPVMVQPQFMNPGLQQVQSLSLVPPGSPTILQVQAPEPVQPVLPDAANQPNVPLPVQPTSAMGGGSIPAGLFGTAGGNSIGSVTGGGGGSATPATVTSTPAVSSSSPSALPTVTPETSSSVVGGGEAIGRNTSDAGDLLRKSIAAPGVEDRFVSPYAHDVRVRSYHVGQLVNYADGGFFFPARDDLDTALSKIDSSWIQDVTLIKGPYSVRYGPGFAFIDIQTLGAPRYQDGWQVHESTSLNWKSNTSNWRGLQSVWGGDETFGFRVGYDIATGGDYRSGGASQVEPAEYNLQNFDVAVGFDLGPNAHFEFKGFHQDERPRLLPGYFTDLTFMTTDSFSGRFLFADDTYRFALDTWTNYTKYAGSNQNPSKAAIIDQVTNFAGSGSQLDTFTNGDADSTGLRAAFTMGKVGSLQVTFGADIRYLNQHLDEYDFTTFEGADIKTNDAVPRSHSVDPGIFMDAVIPVTDRLKIKMGTRADWYITNIDNPDIASPVGPQDDKTATASQFFVTNDFKNQYNLWSIFITPEYKLNENWTLLAGFGYGQRPPTLTEQYALGNFIAVIQNPVNFYIGNPHLSPELNRQVDLALKASYSNFRGGISGFYSWIHNYITYDFDPLFAGPNARSYALANTPEATLWGGELYAEYDMTTWLTPFAVVSYVRGEDETRNQHGEYFHPPTDPGPNKEPLPGIPPLDARLGLRFQDPNQQGRYSVEVSARIVSSQNQAALSLLESPTPGFTVVDIRTFYRATNNLLLISGVENLGNVKYQEHLDARTFAPPDGTTLTGLFRPGISFYFGARMQY